MAEFGRKPITLVEIDLPYCTRTYGSAPCAAVLGTTGQVKCFNSLATCQDTTNYAEGTKVVTYCSNQDGIPDIAGVYPALTNVSTRSGELNLSGIDPKSTALGVRARVNITLQDFKDNDTWLDKYQSERVSGAALDSGIGYNPLDRGSHLARLFTRFPYYSGLPVRVRRGTTDQAPAAMPTENYVIDTLDGPNAGGVVTITAKDILDLATDKKAVYPATSLGKLLTAINDSETTVTLTPAGIGDDDYQSSGLVRVGREIMSFTRSSDVLTVVRGQEGTTAASHAALDIVQECGVLDGLTYNVAIETILKDGTTRFDDWIDSTAWQTENDTWLSGLTIGRVIISKPTGKTTLIGEICQLGVMVWPEPAAVEIRYKVNAPLAYGETYFDVTDEANVIEGSEDSGRNEAQRISALWVYHGVRDWTDDTLAAKNFAKLVIATPSVNRYNVEAYKEIYTRWFGREGDDASAGIIADRLMVRYTNTPRTFEGTLDVKDRDDVKLGALILVENYAIQDVDGAILAEPMQVNYAEYTDGRVKFKAETFRFDANYRFWLDAATAPTDYASATDAQKATGAFWADEASPAATDSVWF